MKESLWRLYGGVYTFVSFQTTALMINRADDNIFRIIVYCRPKRQTIQLSRKPFFGRNVVTLRKQFSDVSLTVPLFQKLVQRGMENIQLGCFALWIRYFPYIVSIKVMPYLNPVFRIISDKIFFGTFEYLRWVPKDFRNLNCGRCLLSSGIPKGKSCLFRKMSIRRQKWPGLPGSCCRLLIPGNCARALLEVVNFIKYDMLGLRKLIPDEGFTANGIAQSLHFPSELTKVELHYVANWNFILVVKWYRFRFFQTFPFRFLVR